MRQSDSIWVEMINIRHFLHSSDEQQNLSSFVSGVLTYRVPGTRTPPLSGIRQTNLYRNASMPASTARPTVTHKMMDQKNNSGTRTALAARSGSGAKEMILMWVQNRIKDYPVRDEMFGWI